MIISFGFNGAGGGGGTSDYNDLSNKPQINGVALSGNKTSQELGITSESLEPVATVPSGASVGDVYAINKSQTVGYGWEQIENGWAFNCSLIPASGDTPVEIGQFVGTNDNTTISIWPNGMVDGFGDSTKAGFIRRNEFDGGYVNENHYDYRRIEFTFEDIDVPTLQNAISSVTKTKVENKAVQVEAANVPLAHWEFWGEYQGRYQNIQFWLEQKGQKAFLPNTELGLFSYYQLYFKLYTNADGFFCVDYSNDSAATWNHYIENANIPVDEPEYYPIDITDPNGKQALFKAWFRSGDGNFGVILKSNKYLWLDNYVTPNGVITKDLLKEGYSYESLSELPQINGVTLSGNVTSDQLGIMSIKWHNYTDGCFMYAREECTNDGDYLVHVGTEIEGSRTYAGVTISNGVITNAGYGGVNNIGDGHWAGNKEDANGVSYFFHCWVEDGYLYWQTSSPIMGLDAYGTGSDLQGGLIY